MPHDTQDASANPRRTIAHAFGEIANTIEWNHAAWLVLMVKLETAGKPAGELTLDDVIAAIHHVHDQLGNGVHA